MQNIDRRLRELIALGEAPVKLSKEELDTLVSCITDLFLSSTSHELSNGLGLSSSITCQEY